MTGEVNKNKRVVWQDVRPAVKPTPPPAVKKPRKKVTLPKLKLPRFIKLSACVKKLSRRQRLFIVAGVGTAIITISAVIIIMRPFAPATPGITDVTKLVKGTPDYNTVLPAGKSTKEIGGWTRVSPPKSNPVYAYADKIGTDSINVSEQPLPADFQKDTQTHLSELAQSFNAGEKITLSGTTAYIATTEKGMQRVFLTKNGLLILMTSNNRISNDAWAGYINSLQ